MLSDRSPCHPPSKACRRRLPAAPDTRSMDRAGICSIQPAALFGDGADTSSRGPENGGSENAAMWRAGSGSRRNNGADMQDRDDLGTRMKRYEIDEVERRLDPAL